jgi:hypothetical protein
LKENSVQKQELPFDYDSTERQKFNSKNEENEAAENYMLVVSKKHKKWVGGYILLIFKLMMNK